MAQLTLVLQILGHDISIGIGMDVEKSQESGEVLVIESSGDNTIRPVGFVRNDEEGDDGDEGRIRGRGLNGW